MNSNEKLLEQMRMQVWVMVFINVVCTGLSFAAVLMERELVQFFSLPISVLRWLSVVADFLVPFLCLLKKQKYTDEYFRRRNTELKGYLQYSRTGCKGFEFYETDFWEFFRPVLYANIALLVLDIIGCIICIVRF